MTIVKSSPNAPFSIATMPRCKGEYYSISWIAPLILDMYLIMLNVKQGGIKYHFLVVGMTRPGIEPQFPGPLANTNHYANGLVCICEYIYTYVCIYMYMCVYIYILIYIHLYIYTQYLMAYLMAHLILNQFYANIMQYSIHWHYDSKVIY